MKVFTKVYLQTDDGSWRPVSARKVDGYDDIYIIDEEGILDRERATPEHPDITEEARAHESSGDRVRVDSEGRVIEVLPGLINR